MNMSSIEEKDNLCLAIVETQEDAVLIGIPFCKDCAVRKLKVIRFCKISNKEAKELIELYKKSIRIVRIKCDCT